MQSETCEVCANQQLMVCELYPLVDVPPTARCVRILNKLHMDRVFLVEKLSECALERSRPAQPHRHPAVY